VAVVGEGPELYGLAALLREAGAEVPLVLQLSGELPVGAGPEAQLGLPLRASGLHHVKSLTYEAAGSSHKVACDAVAVSLPPSPALALATQAGARTAWSEDWNCFHVLADSAGRTGMEGVYAVGSITWPLTAAESAEHGTRAGEAAAAWLQKTTEVSP
jgi:hypothetical protein